MPFIISKFFDYWFARPSVSGGVLWSLGLHAAAFAATYTWWTNPIEPVSFAGNRYVVQLELAFSEMPTELEVETELEFEPVHPPEELTPIVVPTTQHDLVIVPTLLLFDIPLREDSASEDEQMQSSIPENEHQEVELKEVKSRPQTLHDETSNTAAAAVEKQFAGVEDQSPPDLAGNVPPSYPAEAVRKGQEGVVLLRVCIAVSGKVERVEIAESSGHTILDRTAVQAVSMWHARPALRKGKPVATVELLPVIFTLPK